MGNWGRINEIVLRTMKSERGSDEIFSVPPQMKLNPSSLSCRKADFIAKRFHPTIVGFIPSVRTDLIKKRGYEKDIFCVLH